MNKGTVGCTRKSDVARYQHPNFHRLGKRNCIIVEVTVVVECFDVLVFPWFHKNTLAHGQQSAQE